ncbi:MAG TPA: galactose-1-phosphate uridylyltransferase [Gemmatimonadaceae bacterium]|nr:galactose-1-phosphate uridylyltransferase [Gemmatimonadaceae bacterium]
MVWEERWNPLRCEWVIVSSHRNDRPWLGETVGDAARALPDYDPTCYLCPGNVRVSGARNPAYSSVFAFENDHPCVGPLAPEVSDSPPGDAVVQRRSAHGASRVVCFTPRHDLTLAELPLSEIVGLLEALQAQHGELGARAEVRHILMFENKGEVVGVSNPHPHCQIYATNFVFKTIEVEAAAADAHFGSTGRALFADVIAAEETDGRRILATNVGAVSFVPYFARYPYETFIAPRGTHASIATLDAAEVSAFAGVLQETLIRLDNLWEMSLPYVMVLHQAPVNAGVARGFHFHVQIHPPLRRPGLLKYLAGPEVGGGCFLNDTAPEAKAAELRAVSPIHYKRRRDGH